MHTWKETGEVSDRIEKKLLLSGVGDEDRERWWPAPGQHEVTFSIKIDTGELIFWGGVSGSDHDYGYTGDEWKKTFDPQKFLTGTIDYLDGTHVDDLKTGWPVDPKTSGQLRSYALVPWLLRKRPPSYRGLVSITHFPRYPLAARPTRTWATVTGAELALHLDELSWALSNPTIIKPSDDACRFCPSRPNCPIAGRSELAGTEDNE